MLQELCQTPQCPETCRSSKQQPTQPTMYDPVWCVLHTCRLSTPQVGGLGDVVTSLAKAHQATGTLVEIIMPKYDCANYV